MIIEKAVISNPQPKATNVLWLRPMKGGMVMYVYNSGRWVPVSGVDDKGTVTSSDDEFVSFNALTDTEIEDAAKTEGLISE